MLQLKNVVKEYVTGDSRVAALKGINIAFRKNEFVSVLGPSGGGKTTLLNIIGGLDRYTDGNLVIDEKSTHEFSDREWDSYRNHSVGFVFQSYNLIEHQTVLANVELALTLSGVGKAERKKRASDALEAVGLADQIKKKPNQLSGGQMQRVAIARALVNDPEILLADEPTGALDTETSVQVLDILKEVARDRLVIMVTHNPELAEKYSTRIVRLRDGLIIDDSNPFDGEEETTATAKAEQESHSAKSQKTSMSFSTALSLSLNNLMTKRGRTVLTAFAGSIGIIGIALILSLSNGVNNYIADIQENTMSAYPLTIEAQAFDYSSMLEAPILPKEEEPEHERDAVYSNPVMLESATEAVETMTSNNLTDFKKYLDDENSEINKYISNAVYSYDIRFDIFSFDPTGELVGSNIGGDFSGMGGIASQMFSSSEFSEMLPDRDGVLVSKAITEQYELLHGQWPQSRDEVVLVLDANNEIEDYTLYQLGLLPMSEYDAFMSDEEAVVATSTGSIETRKWSYEEICGHSFFLVPACDYYIKGANGNYSFSDNEETLAALAKKGLELKISGIVRPGENMDMSLIYGTVGYTSALTDYVIAYTEKSAAVTAQKASSDINIISGLTFKPDDAAKVSDTLFYLLGIDASEKAELATEILTEVYRDAEQPEQEKADDEQLPQDIPSRDEMIALFASLSGYDESFIRSFLQSRQFTDEELYSYLQVLGYGDDSEPEPEEISVYEALATADDAELGKMLDEYLADAPDEAIVKIYDKYIAEKAGSLEENLSAFGLVDRDFPTAVSLYTTSFENKDAASRCIDDYNSTAKEGNQIVFTDYVAMLMSSVTTMVNAVSYVLIAFVAVSLIVSSIMIGIITYISVLERTKEIGILRAVGASKKDISRVFNAETFIVGLCAGGIGVVLTYLLCIPINAVLAVIIKEAGMTAMLPIISAFVLVGVSIALTLTAGLLPSKLAAKKDPVTALRGE